MKIKKLKHIIKEHIKVLKEQDEMTLNHYLIQICQNNYIFAPLFNSEENEISSNQGYGDLDIAIQNSLQQQFYLNLGTPTPEQAFWWAPTTVQGGLSSGFCIQVTPTQTTLPNFTNAGDVGDIITSGMNMFLNSIDPPLSTLYNSCDECMGGCQIQIENMENYQSFFEFCSKCDNYGGVYPSGTDELYEECCSECEGMEKYKCAASGGGISATYEQSCVATWENDAPFNTLEACQASGCGEFDLEGGPSEFQCSDFLNYNPFPPNSNVDYHEGICSMFCNEWGSGIGSGWALTLSDIPNLDWEEATGPQITGYTPVDDFNIFDPQYETSTVQGYYDPGGLCSLGCCEGLVNPSFGSASENYDVCNEPGNELNWGWLDYSQQEQDLVCAMINNGGSIEVELFGSPVTITIPYSIAIDYWQCCSETGGMPGPDGIALLSKKLTQNDIDKLTTKLKKDEKKAQQLSKANPQKRRMQELAGIIKNKNK